MTKVLLSSGGMDSFLLAMLPDLEGATHLFVNVGQTYRNKERVAAKRIAGYAKATFVEIETINMAAYEHSSGIIPFRNAEMILCAAQVGTHIYMGIIEDEINSDKSVEFCRAIETVLNVSHQKQYWTEGKKFAVLTPFRFSSKTELVKSYLNQGNSLDFLLESVSCYDAGDKHCGHCSSCFKRWVALSNATMRNDYKAWGFVENPATWKTSDQWLAAAQGYSHKRSGEIFTALGYSSKGV